MSSEIITKNDLKAILDTALPTQPVLSDTGWLEAPFTSAFTHYSDDQQVKYRRIGKTVEIVGAAKPTAQLAAGSDTVAFTLPLGFRPSQQISKIQQGTGYNIWFMYINPNGEVHVSRYRTGSTANAIATTVWLNVPITFTVENQQWPVTPVTCADYVIEEGTSDGWEYRKWASGKYEAEKVDNIGTVSLSSAYFTIEGSVKMWLCSAIPSSTPTPPHTLVSDYSILYEYLSNSTGYTFVVKTSADGKIQLARAGSEAISLSNVKLVYKILNGRWK